MRPALRTVASSWFATTTMARRQHRGVEHAEVRSRHVEHGVGGTGWPRNRAACRAGAVRSASTPAGRTTPADRGPTPLCTTRLLKNAASSRCRFSSASTTENRGSAPRKTAASPYARCRSIRSAPSGDSFASDVATFTAIVVVPTPPLAPTKAKTGPAGAWRPIAHQPRDRRVEAPRRHRLGDELVDAGAHRLAASARDRAAEASSMTSVADAAASAAAGRRDLGLRRAGRRAARPAASRRIEQVVRGRRSSEIASRCARARARAALELRIALNRG